MASLVKVVAKARLALEKLATNYKHSCKSCKTLKILIKSMTSMAVETTIS